ncbi:hypothetical protein ABZ403_09730 [Micromonospora zamorensis]|uniref:hypothetical protein n=1 Tax=Micromonospora zamorensis TaxID=709883 RepID=UPI0033FA8D30
MLLVEGRAALNAVDAAVLVVPPVLVVPAAAVPAAAVPAAALAALPVVDAPSVTMVIAWLPRRRSLALAGLIRAAARPAGSSAVGRHPDEWL